MKRLMLSSLPLVCLLASGIGASALAQGAAAGASTAAATPGVTKIAVINFQAAVAQTNEGQRNFGELQKKFDPKRTQLKSLQDEIDNLKKQLQASGDKLSDAERQTRLKTIDEKEKEYQRTGEDASNDFQQEMQQTYQQLAEKVFNTVQSYAEQNGYSVVLDASASPQQGVPTVLWANKTTDITAAVIQAYNAKSGVPAPAAPASSSVPSAPAPTHSATAPRSTGSASPKQ
ncbi:MAG: OmpH family outer membrane protein [Acidobacteriaceae bacterium]|nr:OmpH family outer membrane protein [Acidobacteriaceae bacterium]